MQGKPAVRLSGISQNHAMQCDKIIPSLCARVLDTVRVSYKLFKAAATIKPSPRDR